MSFAETRYDAMKYRRCGRSGVMLPMVSLGLWQSIGAAGADDVARQCVRYAFDHGVTHFDLANNYGPPPGSAEEIFGRIAKDMPRDELIISTKAGYRMWPGPYGEWGSRKYVLASLDQSLRRMGLEYVDIFYSHRFDPHTPLEETMGALEQAVRQGKALYAGVSNYAPVPFRDAVDIRRRHGWSPLLIHQPYYNMLTRDAETLLPHTAAEGVGVIAFCPLAQGVLSTKYLNGLPADSRFGQAGAKWHEDHAKSGTWKKVAALNEIAQSRGQTLPQLALTWLLRDDRVTTVLIGASRLEQVKENLAIVNQTPLTAEELEKIEDILK